jgi:hypothetical protein
MHLIPAISVVFIFSLGLTVFFTHLLPIFIYFPLAAVCDCIGAMDFDAIDLKPAAECMCCISKHSSSEEECSAAIEKKRQTVMKSTEICYTH